MKNKIRYLSPEEWEELYEEAQQEQDRAGDCVMWFFVGVIICMIFLY